MTEQQLQAVRAELRELMGTWQYAYAFGAGCGNAGNHPDYRATRARVADLRAQIREHTP
jgi:hypothetical protein